MAEIEIDKDSRARAERLSSDLLIFLRAPYAATRSAPEFGQQVREVREHAAEDELRLVISRSEPETPLDDVENDFQHMARVFELSRRSTRTVACLQLGDGTIAPLSLHKLGHASLQAILALPSARELPLDEAEDCVQKGITLFLSLRLAWLKRTKSNLGILQASPLPAVGNSLQVQVSCRSQGLRLHVAPAYFVNWTYFGNPTTPVVGHVLPGRYIFSADGPTMPRIIDSAVFSIPPDFYPALTAF